MTHEDALALIAAVNRIADTAHHAFVMLIVLWVLSEIIGLLDAMK